METTDALYVYGVVPKGTSPDIFANVGAEVELVEGGELAAIASRVPLAEFGEEALEANLKDPAWLEQKVNEHNAILAACVGVTTVLPFRFAAVYRDDDQVLRMLAERPELVDTLARLEGAVELGVKALLDPEALRARLAHARGLDPEVGSGRAYMMWKQLERELDEEVRSFAASPGAPGPFVSLTTASISLSTVTTRSGASSMPAVAGTVAGRRRSAYTCNIYGLSPSRRSSVLTDASSSRRPT